MNAQIFIAHENKWVATDKFQKEIFAAHKNLKDLQKNLKQLNIKNAVVMFVPDFSKSLAPQCL